MSEFKNDTVTLAFDNILSLIWIGLKKLAESFRECFYGYQNGILPFQRLAIITVIISFFWSLKFDVAFLKMIHSSFPGFSLGPPVGLLRLILWVTSSASPFIIWGWRRQSLIQNILKLLRDAFESAGLKNNDRYPALVREYVTDNGSRRLQFLSDGIIVGQYLEKQSVLENKLGVKIEEIREHPRLSKIIELEFADGDLPKLFNLENVLAYKDFTFPIGKTRTEIIIGDLKMIPHYLFAGMTGKGKSTFIKTMISVLITNNKNLLVKFIDLKGTEIADFEGHARFESAADVSGALSKIKAVNAEMEDRKLKFRTLKVSDITAFNELAMLPNSTHEVLPRILLVVDEIAQLTPSLAIEEHEKVKHANLLLNKISRLGRSFGLHLIVGVQKPDTRNLDSTIKANLEGILCFQVANRIQSQVVLDSNKASNLNSIPGRGIWQVGGEDRTVQTPYLTKDQIKKLIKKENDERVIPEQAVAPANVVGAGSSQGDQEDQQVSKWNEFNE